MSGPAHPASIAMRAALAFALSVALAACAPTAPPTPSPAASGPVAAASQGPDGDRLREARIGYAITMRAEGMEQRFDGVRVIERGEHRGRAVWRTVDSDPSSPMADTSEVDAATLAPVRRVAASQGMTYAFEDGRVVGEMAYGDESMPFEIALSGPATAAEAPFELLLAGMDLVPGEVHTLRVFNPYSQSIRPMTLTVGDPGETTTEAGTFDTFRLELVPVDGDGHERATFEVLRTAPHYVILAEYALPQIAGGGSIGIEATAVEIP